MRGIAFALALVCACAPSSRSNPGDDDTGSNTGSSGSNATGSDGCSDAAKLIYVVDINNKLAKFDPVAKAFTTIGTLACKTTTLGIPDGATPFSMAIDRTAQAYVLYSDGNIMKVDTTQASLPCTATNWKAGTDGLMQFGMGYSTDTAGGTTDTLFVSGGASTGTGNSTLAKLDTTSMSATTVGMVSGSPELTGNANAELWAFSPSVNSETPTVQQLDKASGAAVITYMLPTLAGNPSAWAFGFYGGDYWVFLEKNGESNTTVYEIAGPTNMTHAPGSVVGTTPASGLEVVGAGVSTCAPTQIF
jgi:hypothetical protein